MRAWLLDGGGVRAAEVLDVAGRVLDLLDLQRVDDQAELLHLGARRLAGQLGELLAVADHLLDRHVADDGAQVTGEDVVDPLVHLVLLVEEAAGRVGDRREVVADLVDDHAADAERDALVRDAVDGQVGLAQVEREPPHGLHAGEHERALAGDDLEAEALLERVGGVLVPEAGDDQGLVRLGHAPHGLEDDDGDDDGDDRRADDDVDAVHVMSSVSPRLGARGR